MNANTENTENLEDEKDETRSKQLQGAGLSSNLKSVNQETQSILFFACMCLSFFLFRLVLGLAVVCDCGIPWTFL